MTNKGPGAHPVSRLALDRRQVEAACRLRATLSGWNEADAILLDVRQRYPSTDRASCIVKSVLVNQLYSTRVFAITEMGSWISAKLSQTPIPSDVDLVDRIASLELAGRRTDARVRRFTSFASKWCSFFCDEERFPIYDDAARETLKHHFGRDLTDDPLSPYGNFFRAFRALQATVGCSAKELDYYLWITGMFMRWSKSGTAISKRVNKELRGAFEAANCRGSLLEGILPKDVPFPAI